MAIIECFMSRKNNPIEKQVNSFLDEVGVYSSEHLTYLEKLNRVLEDMKNSSNSAERKLYPSFNETVRSFENFLKEKNIKLTPQEKDRLTVIAASGLGNMAKKRMVEDLIHSVRERHAAEIEMKIEEEKRKREIEGLKKSSIFIINWYRLFKFALSYGTITIFSHRLSGDVFETFRNNLSAWFNEVRDPLKDILDKYYFYLSVYEYNAIKRIFMLGEPISSMMGIKKMLSYSEIELHDTVTTFAQLYISMIANLKYIDSGLQKIYKSITPPHGFWGFIGLLTDRPMLNGKIVRYDESDFMKKSIKGFLFSYYTVYAGTPVTTMNQLIYLVGDDGSLDGTVKELTEEALKDMETKESQEHSEVARISARLDEITELLGTGRDLGVKLSNRIMSLESKGAWVKESQSRPFFKIFKVMDGLKKYILEILRDSENFILSYDDKDYVSYLETRSELLKAIDDFITFTNEVQGTREKEVTAFRFDSQIDSSLESFIKRLVNNEIDPPKIPNARNMRETLRDLSASSYNLCMRFNDIINFYKRNSKLQSSNFMDNFDFFINAKIVHPKCRNLELLLNKRDVTLADAMEGGRGLSEYIAESLYHPGIAALFKEMDNLKEESKKYISSEQADSLSEKDKSQDEEIEPMYRDSLSGVKNWAYFEDIIRPAYYNDEFKYKYDTKRYVFALSIANLQDINRISGKTEGDKIFKKLVDVAIEKLSVRGKGNVALRDKDAVIVGFIMDCERIEAIDILYSIYRKVMASVIAGDITVKPEPLIYGGLYTERKGTNVYHNIEMAKKIMTQAADGEHGHVAFLKREDLIIQEKDLDRKGHLKEGLISVLR
ncbi:MAG TPA: hypothetical protein PKZ93_00775 [Spirochaetota bacterium]|nr:hypothetical protein [Spirochaetota bacterium]